MRDLSWFCVVGLSEKTCYRRCKGEPVTFHFMSRKVPLQHYTKRQCAQDMQITYEKWGRQGGWCASFKVYLWLSDTFSDTSNLGRKPWNSSLKESSTIASLPISPALLIISIAKIAKPSILECATRPLPLPLPGQAAVLHISCACIRPVPGLWGAALWDAFCNISYSPALWSKARN